MLIRLDNTKVVLDNGVEVKHFIAGIFTITEDKKFEIVLDGFANAEKADAALSEFTLRAEQDKIVEQFEKLVHKENPTKTEQNKLDKLQEQINEMADKIDNAPKYDELVVETITVEIPYTEDTKITDEYIVEELLKLDIFNGAIKYEVKKGE